MIWPHLAAPSRNWQRNETWGRICPDAAVLLPQFERGILEQGKSHAATVFFCAEGNLRYFISNAADRNLSCHIIPLIPLLLGPAPDHYINKSKYYLNISFYIGVGVCVPVHETVS